MVVLGLLAGLADNFVRPMILQGRSKMHPLVSLVAIFGGMEMFGIMGIFLGSDPRRGLHCAVTDLA